MEERASRPTRGGSRSGDGSKGDLGPVPLSKLVATSDIALIVDRNGIVRDASFGDKVLEGRTGAAWLDRALVETVTVESRDKVRRMLATAPGDAIAWYEINHPLDGGDQPMRYAPIRLESDGPLVVLGRDLGGLARLQRQLVDANLSVERDYALYRSAETQMRLLFQTSTEPLLVLGAVSQRIAEANPAAEDLLRRVGRRLAGMSVDEVFAEASVTAVTECLASARANGQGRCPSATLSQGSATVAVSAWLMRSADAPQLLVRLSPAGVAAGAPDDEPWDALRHLPEAMLTAADNLDIIDANGAFLDLVDMATANQVRSESLSRFVGRHGVDIDLLSARLQEGGSVRRYPTVVRGQYGALRDVEISVGSLDRTDGRVYAFLFRPLANERQVPAEPRKPLRPVSEMTDLVGRVPLRDIVREATDIIEELCIEAALDVTQDNRASAAEMLGLSRQSLYSKLRRYGLGDLPGDGSSAP